MKPLVTYSLCKQICVNIHKICFYKNCIKLFLLSMAPFIIHNIFGHCVILISFIPFKSGQVGTSMAVLQLRLWAPAPGVTGSIPGRELRSYMPCSKCGERMEEGKNPFLTPDCSQVSRPWQPCPPLAGQSLPAELGLQPSQQSCADLTFICGHLSRVSKELFRHKVKKQPGA